MLRWCSAGLTLLVMFGLTVARAYADPVPSDPPVVVSPDPGNGVIGIGVHDYPLPRKQGDNGGPGFEGVSADTGGVRGDICGDPTIVCPAEVQAQKCGVINETFG